MPIKPENRGRYPKEWSEMRLAVTKRSGNRCECEGQCGHEHPNGRCGAYNGLPHPVTRSTVVLTMAHYHGTALESTDIADVFHACQRCHLVYDKHIHRANRQTTLHRRRAMSDLFE